MTYSKEKKMIHIQNTFDVLMHNGSGVSGKLIPKCLYLLNRSILIGRENDYVVVTENCSDNYYNYIRGLRRIGKLNLVKISFDLGIISFLDSRIILREIENEFEQKKLSKNSLQLSPYFKSKHFFSFANDFDWEFSESDWKKYVIEDFAGRMNDKIMFYSECENLGIPVPRYWVHSRKGLQDGIFDLLDLFSGIIIRGSRNGGGLGNMVVLFVEDDMYEITDFKGKKRIFKNELSNAIENFIKESNSERFITSQYLNLIDSPSSLFYVNKDKIEVVAHSSQMLNSNGSFIGFNYPIEDVGISALIPQMEKHTFRIASFMQTKGYVGYGNVDWMVTMKGKLYAAERNARQTAVVPPLSLVSDIFYNGNHVIKLPKDKFIIVNDNVLINKKHDFKSVLELLKSFNLNFCKKKKIGIIVTMPPMLKPNYSEIGILSIGNSGDRTQKCFDFAVKILN